MAQRLRDAPTEPVSLDQVAQLAKVARSTIYLVFGSRVGLFNAFVDDLWARIQHAVDVPVGGVLDGATRPPLRRRSG